MESIIIILIGFVIVSIFDALGSLLSRLLKFKYVWLTFGSILIYGAVAFYTAKSDGLIIGVIASAIIGIFDATIGSLISRKLKANIPEKDIENMKTTPKLVLSVGAFCFRYRTYYNTFDRLIPCCIVRFRESEHRLIRF